MKGGLFPQAGGRLSIELFSPDRRENVALDITRAQIKVTEATYQNRARQAIILMRLDPDGPPHRNPDDQARQNRARRKKLADQMFFRSV